MVKKTQAIHTLLLIAQAESPIPGESLVPANLGKLEGLLPDAGIVDAGEVVFQLVKSNHWNFARVRNHKFTLCPAPMVIEVFHSTASEEVFLRMRCNVDRFDGVSLLQTGFNALEYLEQGPKVAFSRLPFENPKQDYGYKNRLKLLGQLGGLTSRFLRDVLLRMSGGLIARRQHLQSKYSGPLEVIAKKLTTKSQTATCLMYQMTNANFRAALAKVDALRKDLGLAGYMCTVNYRPHVAISQVSEVQDLLKQQKRIEGIILPAKPAPRKSFGKSMLFSRHCFWNNYGRYSPNIKGHIKKLYWDWLTLSWAVPMVVHTISAQGQCWLMVRVPPKTVPWVKEFLSCFGTPEEFSSIPLSNLEPSKLANEEGLDQGRPLPELPTA